MQLFAPDCWGTLSECFPAGAFLQSVQLHDACRVRADIRMPAMSGVQLQSHLRDQGYNSLKKGAGGKNATGPSNLHLIRSDSGKLLRTIHHGRGSGGTTGAWKQEAGVVSDWVAHY